MAVPQFIPANVFAAGGANGRVRVGLIGTGNRPRDLLKESPPELSFAALADCDLRQIADYRKWAQKNCPGKLSETCPQYQDYREMLDKEKLDAVIVATPTHVRVLICLHAMQAGLDVYAEKPLTLTIEEGQYLIRAERKYGRVFQTGTQQRSIPINNFGSDLVRQWGDWQGPHGAMSELHRAGDPHGDGRGGDSGGDELGRMVPADGARSVQLETAPWAGQVGPLARL